MKVWPSHDIYGKVLLWNNLARVNHVSLAPDFLRVYFLRWTYSSGLSAMRGYKGNAESHCTCNVVDEAQGYKQRLQQNTTHNESCNVDRAREQSETIEMCEHKFGLRGRECVTETCVGWPERDDLRLIGRRQGSWKHVSCWCDKAVGGMTWVRTSMGELGDPKAYINCGVEIQAV